MLMNCITWGSNEVNLDIQKITINWSWLHKILHMTSSMVWGFVMMIHIWHDWTSCETSIKPSVLASSHDMKDHGLWDYQAKSSMFWLLILTWQNLKSPCCGPRVVVYMRLSRKSYMYMYVTHYINLSTYQLRHFFMWDSVIWCGKSAETFQAGICCNISMSKSLKKIEAEL